MYIIVLLFLFLLLAIVLPPLLCFNVSDYHFDVSCQGTVPPAIIACLESHDYESARRNAISLGGDADTVACITGSIAHAFYQDIPQLIIDEVVKRLPDEFLKVIDSFDMAYTDGEE